MAYAEEKNHLYRELLTQMSPADLTPEVERTLSALRKSGLKLAIGSSSKNARFILNRLGILELFDAISDGSNITRSKPDPEVFLKAAEYVNEEPSDCLVVEDAVAGVEAAAAGGMKCAAMGDAMSSHLANYRLNSFSRLIDIVK